jgi:hypothetical protein
MYIGLQTIFLYIADKLKEDYYNFEIIFKIDRKENIKEDLLKKERTNNNKEYTLLDQNCIRT